MTSYDCIIIGDGPAGLSAGIYMSRAEHSNIIIGSGTGRWHYGQINQNYLGFPDGVAVDELHRLGLAQARNYGSEFLSGKVIDIKKTDDGYKVEVSTGENYMSQVIIYAAGVTDRWPKNLDIEKYVGTFTYWCITCDGFRAKGKSILVVADVNTNIETILQFKDFTDNITVICDCDASFIDESDQNLLTENGIKVINDHFISIEGSNEMYRVEIGGESYIFSMMFSLLGSIPNSELIKDCQCCSLNEKGYIVIDDKNRTDNASFFAAGDVTDKHSHQVVTAAHEGAQAAQAASYYLYKHS